MMRFVGNANMNSVLEENSSLVKTVKPNSNSPRNVRETFIIQKYKEKKFVQTKFKSTDLAFLLYSVLAHHPPYPSPISQEVFQLIVNGAPVTIQNTQDSLQTPLHRLAEINHPPLAEFLLRNGARLDLGDDLGKTPLHFAVSFNHETMCSLYVSRGADIHKEDADGYSPVDLSEFYSFENCYFVLRNTVSVKKQDESVKTVPTVITRQNSKQDLVKGGIKVSLESLPRLPKGPPPTAPLPPLTSPLPPIRELPSPPIGNTPSSPNPLPPNPLPNHLIKVPRKKLAPKQKTVKKLVLSKKATSSSTLELNKSEF